MSIIRGYLASVLIETPVLVAGLSPRHSLKRKLWCGAWLTACTYPIVTLVLPGCPAYLLIAETFAPVAECALFWLAFGRRPGFARDMAAIVLANLASFGAGVLLGWTRCL